MEGADRGASAPSAAFQPTSGTIGSWMWMTSNLPWRSSRRGATTPPAGNGARLDTAPLAENPAVRPSGTR